MNKDSLKRTVYVISISLLIIAVLVVFFSLAFMERSRRQAIYNKAMEYIDEEDYISASAQLETILDFNDASDVFISLYSKAQEQKVRIAYETKDYDYVLNSIGNIESDEERVEMLNNIHYQLGLSEYSKMNYGSALGHFGLCKSYKDSDFYYIKIVNIIKPHLFDTLYTEALNYISDGNTEMARFCLEALVDYDYLDSRDLMDKLNQ